MDRLNDAGRIAIARIQRRSRSFEALSVDAQRFRRARLRAGLTGDACAKLLRVTRRTVTNWEAGRVRIPYSALRLLRIESAQRLPGKTFAGWYIEGDYLCSPIGHRFCQAELSWLSLTFRRAEAFSKMYDQLRELRQALAASGGCPQSPQPAAAPARLQLAGSAGGEAEAVDPCGQSAEGGAGRPQASCPTPRSPP